MLQVVARTLASPAEQGPTVTLLGVSHVGDRSYYEKIQKKLDAAALVLFEGVGFGDDGPPQGNRDDGGGVSELQLSLASSMGLVFQLQAIRYDRPHFRNSDISPEALLSKLQGGKGKPSAKGGSGGKGDAPDKGKPGGKTDKGNFESRQFVEALGSIEGDVTRLAEASGPGMRKFMRALLEDRNAIVFRDLRKVLKQKKPPKSIVVFYGAAHMPDLEERIVEKLGFKPAGDEWLTAFGVNPKKAGLSAFEVGLVRKMIRVQLQQDLKERNKEQASMAFMTDWASLSRKPCSASSKG